LLEFASTIILSTEKLAESDTSPSHSVNDSGLTHPVVS